MTPRLDAVAAVVASRESAAVLEQTLHALAVAQPGVTRVDVLINGNPALARDIAARLAAAIAPHAAPGWWVWHHPLRDKANALNHYVHDIWPGGLAYFVDGYARVRPDALGRLHATLQAQPEAHAVAAVPSAGRTAARAAAIMLREGGLHGNLFGLRAQALARFREDRFRLPVGMYRVDATMGSVLCFNFDPAAHPWDLKRRIAVDGAATWDVDAPAWWKPQTLRAHLQRRVRQAQGQVENEAVRQWLAIEKRPPCELQADVHALISAWQARDPEGYQQRLQRQQLRAYAMRKLFAQPDTYPLAGQAYELVFEQPASEDQP